MAPNIAFCLERHEEFMYKRQIFVPARAADTDRGRNIALSNRKHLLVCTYIYIFCMYMYV